MLGHRHDKGLYRWCRPDEDAIADALQSPSERIFSMGSESLSFYGPDTPKAFGHIGFTNVVAWADSERDLSVAIKNNGKPLITPGVLLWLNIMRVIAQLVPRDACAEWTQCFQ